jgi:hypothetical protein
MLFHFIDIDRKKAGKIFSRGKAIQMDPIAKDVYQLCGLDSVTLGKPG